MKKVNVLVILGFLASLTMFTSCDPTTGDPIGPEIVGVSSSVTVESGQEFSLNFVVKEGDAKLTEVIIKEGNGVVYKASDSTAKVEDGMQIIYSADLAVGTYVFTITATDKADVETVETINVIVNSDLTDNGTKILGASANSTTGSYYSLVDNSVLLSAAAAAAPSKVTFLFNFTTTDNAFIASGTLSGNTTVAAGATETLFAIQTGITFETASSDDITVTPDVNKIANLAEGDVIAFETADGDYGLIKVTSITTGTDGSISVGIKVK